MHSLKVAHLDIKIENFLIFDRIKLIDFNTIFEAKKTKIVKNRPYGTFLY